MKKTHLHPSEVPWFELDREMFYIDEDCDYDPKSDYVVGTLKGKPVFYEFDMCNVY